MNLLTTRFATGASNTKGAATFVFRAVTQGQWWNVACTVPSAPTTARFSFYVDERPRFTWLGSQPSPSVIVASGSRIKIVAAGLAKTTTYQARLDGGWAPGLPQGLPPLVAPSSFTSIVNFTTINLPVTTTVGVFTGRATLKGTTTKVPIIPATRTPSYWEHLKIGWSIWSTETNTGTFIYIGDSAGGTPKTWARIPSGKTKLLGKFTIRWGNAWVARVAGKTGDQVNVWAA